MSSCDYETHIPPKSSGPVIFKPVNDICLFSQKFKPEEALSILEVQKRIYKNDTSDFGKDQLQKIMDEIEKIERKQTI